MTAIAWAKIAANFFASRKVRKAGPHGWGVFLFVLCCNAARGATGSIPLSDLEDWYLADQLQWSLDEVRDGITKACVAELIEVDGDEVLIVGWDADEWGKGPMSTTERKRKSRAKRDMSRPIVTGHEARDGHTGEERRGEEVEERNESTRVRTCDPVVPEVVPGWDAGSAARAAWRRFADSREALRVELGLDVRPLALEDVSKRDLTDRFRVGGERSVRDFEHVLAVLEGEARSKRTLKWFGSRSFTEHAWAHKLGVSVADVTKSSGRVEPLAPNQYPPDGDQEI